MSISYSKLCAVVLMLDSALNSWSCEDGVVVCRGEERAGRWACSNVELADKRPAGVLPD